MKRTIMSGAFLILIVVLFSGCGTLTYHSQTKPHYLPENTPLKLNITHPVAIKNVSSKAPGTEEILGSWGAVEVMGSLYDFTESTIGIVKEALQRNNITIDDKADKRLELSIVKATSIRGFWTFSSDVTLRVKTGSGLEKEYKGLKHHQNGYSTTRAFEMTMARCVEQMLNDKAIVEYLEK